jgi:DNA polymerase IV
MSSLVSPACILHLDADAFFASIEQRDDPRLRGQPVAVGTGVVASCSYEARGWGVRTGMRLTEARRRCRPLRVLPGDYRRYEQAGRRMLAICQDHTPQVEVAALDDLYLDLGPSEPPAAERFALDLRGAIGAEVGLSVSVGIGANKLVAAVATQEAKLRRVKSNRGEGQRGREAEGQRGKAVAGCGFAFPLCPSAPLPLCLVRVPAGGERDYLAPWPAEVLPGVGPKLRARLYRLNVRRVAHVAAVPLPVLCGLFGNRGRVLRDLAHGIDPRPVQPHRPQLSVSRCTSFDPPSADHAFLVGMLDHLMDRAVSWLRFNDLATRGLTVTLRYGDYETADIHTTFRRPTDQEPSLKEAARDRLRGLYKRRLPLRFLGVELSPLRPRDPQPDLFPDPAQVRDRRLAACKDAIRRQFGFMSLVNGSALFLADKVAHDRDNFRLRTPCLTR